MTLLALGDVLLATERGEAPVLADDDLLAAGELVLAAAEGFDGGGAVCIACVVSSCYFDAYVEGSDLRESRVRTESRIWPMFTRATRPLGLPKAPRMPVWRRSAPAHDNILLMRTTW